MTKKRLRIFLLTAITCCGRALADEPNRPTPSPTESNPATPAAGHSLHGDAFNEGPRQAAALLPGMGKVHFAVTTQIPQAQAFVDQGVAQLHSFYYYESERSFRQAAKLDPGCPMVYWGMAMANVNNPKRARGFLAEALTRAGKTKPSRREELYIESLGALFASEQVDKGARQNFLLGLETIVQEFPDDFNARAWLAMATWQSSQDDGIGSRQAIDMLIESVIRDEPVHPGAHHYRIHLWDGKKPARAEKSAGLYAGTAPGIAHAWHMPGHTYTSLNRFADAAYQQEGSARVDHAAMARDGTMPFQIFNYAHNNQWLATSLSHVGRVRESVEVARNLVEQPRDPANNGPKDGGSAQRVGRLRWAEVLARYELWDDLLGAIESRQIDWSDLPEEAALKAYHLGLAYAAKGDKDKLGAQLNALIAATPKPDKPADASKKGEEPRNSNAPLIAELEGHRALLNADLSAAFERFGKAGRMRPESLARAQLAARNFGFAESTAKKAVENNPSQIPPLAALVEVLHACGKEPEAREAYRKLTALARNADKELPVMSRLATFTKVWETTPPGETQETGRIDLTTLGPLGWEPNSAAPIELADTSGATWSLSSRAGRNVIVLFFLGGKCPHCMQQLQLFGKELEAFGKLNTDIVAVSTDDVEATRALKTNAEGVNFPMPILSNPSLDRFKAYKVFDDFEDVPLHGTFFIDAKGKVRHSRVSADPFLDVDFLKGEIERINRILKFEAGSQAAR
ncbi:redoxin domain-containing protein [Isosphaeraceae bacterium EP7]